MGKKIDLTGQRFGLLTVVKEVTERRDNGKVNWRCICECGNLTVTSGTYLKRGLTKSCGCLRRRSRSEAGHVGLVLIYAGYRYSARRRGIEFLLTIDDFKKTAEMPCYYCASQPSQVSRGKFRDNDVEKIKRSSWVYNGIDRVDNLVGYTTSNVVPCCGTCNQIKMDMKTEDLFAHLEKMIAVYKERNKEAVLVAPRGRNK